jgi:hypothetical protein
MICETPERLKEHELLLCCAAAGNDETARARLRLLASGNVDWDYLLTTAEAHGLLPLLRKRLDEAGSSPERLLSACISNAGRNLALTGELVRLVSIFEQSGIECLPFKGPALADQLFGSIAMRQYCDMDLLVRPRDVAGAKQVLLSRGYKPEFTLSSAREHDYIRSEHAFQFRKDEFVVELHWKFGSKDQCFPLDASDVWSRLEARTLQGRPIQALSREDLFVYLCMHGAKHGWERLEWICSLAQLARTQPPVNWIEVAALARRTGALRGLHLGLLLIRDLCAVPLPPALAESTDGDFRAQQLALQVRADLFAPRQPHPVREFRRQKFYLYSRERLTDRIRIVLFSSARIPHPLAKDWDLFRLPASMSFLYYLLRPIRLFREYGLRLLQG